MNQNNNLYYSIIIYKTNIYHVKHFVSAANDGSIKIIFIIKKTYPFLQNIIIFSWIVDWENQNETTVVTEFGGISGIPKRNWKDKELEFVIDLIKHDKSYGRMSINS